MPHSARASAKRAYDELVLNTKRRDRANEVIVRGSCTAHSAPVWLKWKRRLADCLHRLMNRWQSAYKLSSSLECGVLARIPISVNLSTLNHLGMMPSSSSSSLIPTRIDTNATHSTGTAHDLRTCDVGSVRTAIQYFHSDRCFAHFSKSNTCSHWTFRLHAQRSIRMGARLGRNADIR